MLSFFTYLYITLSEHYLFTIFFYTETNGDFLESGGRAGARKMMHAARGSDDSVNAVTLKAGSNDIMHQGNTVAHHPHNTLSGIGEHVTDLAFVIQLLKRKLLQCEYFNL